MLTLYRTPNLTLFLEFMIVSLHYIYTLLKLSVSDLRLHSVSLPGLIWLFCLLFIYLNILELYMDTYCTQRME